MVLLINWRIYKWKIKLSGFNRPNLHVLKFIFFPNI